jgi:hypothetical protein
MQRRDDDKEHIPMTALVGMIGTLAVLNGFTLDASGTGEVTLTVTPDSARALLREIRILEQYMPGVAAVAVRSDGAFDYRTVREIPFSGEMRTDFVVRCTVDRSGNVCYQSPDSTAPNWMRFAFTFAPADGGMTDVRMTLRVRLTRESGTEIHLLAPVLGEEFLSERMESDINGMLEEFAGRLTEACEAPLAGRGTDAR